jgi:predicted dienelactone hydrolase
MLVVGSADPIAPPAENADYLRANIRGAREAVLPGVAHYTFLSTCTPAGQHLLPQYCADPTGVDREAIHQQVSDMAVQFFGKTLHWR